MKIQKRETQLTIFAMLVLILIPILFIICIFYILSYAKKRNHEIDSSSITTTDTVVSNNLVNESSM